MNNLNKQENFDSSLIQSYLYKDFENSYKIKQKNYDFILYISKSLSKLNSNLEKYIKDNEMIKEELSSYSEEKNFIDNYLLFQEILLIPINENSKMINRILESITSFINSFKSIFIKYEDFFNYQKQLSIKLNEINNHKNIYLQATKKAESFTYNYLKNLIFNNIMNQIEHEEKEKLKNNVKDLLEEYKNKISEGNKELKIFNEKQKEIFKLDKDFDIEYRNIYFDLLNDSYQNQSNINVLISNELNKIKNILCNYYKDSNNTKLEDNYKPLEEIGFIQYNSEINFNNCKDKMDLSLCLMTYNEITKIIGNYMDIEIEKENNKIDIIEKITKILNMNEKLSEKDKEELLDLVKNNLGQKIFINLLSQLRANGQYEKSEIFSELIGKVLNIILEYAEKENNYDKAKNCIILSQTFFFLDLNKQKNYIFRYIKNNKWLKSCKFWRGFIGLMLKQEFEKFSNLKKQKLSDILLSQLLPYINNMKQFELDIRIIVKIVDEFLEQYNYLTEESYKILFKILSDDINEIEKYREEYKKNPELENQLYNNENSDDNKDKK